MQTIGKAYFHITLTMVSDRSQPEKIKGYPYRIALLFSFE